MSNSTVSDRHARLLRILARLQSGSGLDATAMAGELGVCRRTIFRDLKMMRQADVQIYYDKRLSCYRLLPQEGLTTAPTLDQEELTILVAAVHLSVLRNLPDCCDLLSQSIFKLLAKSSRRVRNHATRVIKSCSVNVGKHEDSVEATQVVHCILRAISRRKILRLKVVEPEANQEVETHFAPYQVIAVADTWQVMGRSSHHCGVRTFDPRHLRQLEITDEVYAIPRQFKLPC